MMKLFALAVKYPGICNPGVSIITKPWRDDDRAGPSSHAVLNNSVLIGFGTSGREIQPDRRGKAGDVGMIPTWRDCTFVAPASFILCNRWILAHVAAQPVAFRFI
jgi:hypothetical protein